MEGKVLVAYASKYGATAEIAEKVGEVLRQKNLEVDVKAIDNKVDPASYKAVILGSAAYIGKWRKEAVKFLEGNEKALDGKPVWIFTSGPTGKGDPVELTKGWRYPASLQPVIERLKPRDVAVFHGAIYMEKMNFLEKFAIKNVKAEIGDFRDWKAISAWAEGIGAALA